MKSEPRQTDAWPQMAENKTLLPEPQLWDEGDTESLQQNHEHHHVQEGDTCHDIQTDTLPQQTPALCRDRDGGVWKASTPSLLLPHGCLIHLPGLSHTTVPGGWDHGRSAEVTANRLGRARGAGTAPQGKGGTSPPTEALAGHSDTVALWGPGPCCLPVPGMALLTHRDVGCSSIGVIF